MTQILGQQGSSGAKTSAAKMLEGAALWIYGHSYAAVPAFNNYATPSQGAGSLATFIPYPGGGEWPARLAARYGMQLNAKAVTSSRMIDTAFGTIGTNYPGANGNRSMAQSSANGVFVLDSEINDIVNNSLVADATYQKMFKNSLRAILARIEAVSIGGQIIESSSGTVDLAGNWTTPSNAFFSGGTARATTVQNAWLQFSVTTAASADHVWLALFAYDTGAAFAQWTISLDGSDITASCLTQFPNYGIGEAKTVSTTLAGTMTFQPAFIKIPIASAGAHTVKITKTDATTNPLYIDTLYVPGSARMPVLILKDPPIVSSTTAGNPTYTYTTAYNTFAPTYHGFIDTVAAEFTNVFAVDLNTARWDLSTMIHSADTGKLHPNDRGHSYFADVIGAYFESTLLTALPLFSAGVSTV